MEDLNCGPNSVLNDVGYHGYTVESKALVVAIFAYTVELVSTTMPYKVPRKLVKGFLKEDILAHVNMRSNLLYIMQVTPLVYLMISTPLAHVNMRFNLLYNNSFQQAHLTYT